MKGKELRIRAARLLAVVYVMYVVMSGMAIPGADGSYKPLFKTKAATNLNFVEVSNKEALDAAGAGTVSATNASEGTKVTMFSIDKSSSTNRLVGQFNIYSVKYNNKDYYYDPTNKGDGTKEGLFYSDALHKWGFVFPKSSTGPYSIQVQTTLYLNSTPSNISSFNESFQPGAKVGEYEQFSNDVLTEINSKLSLQYYNYDAKFVTTTCSAGGLFNTSNLRFYCLTAENNHYTYRIQYGEDEFLYQGDINNPVTFHVWKTSSPTASAYRQPGTNQLVVDTNIPDATKWLQVVVYAEGGPTGTASYPSQQNNYLTYNNGTIYGTPKISFEDGQFYLPLTVSSSDLYNMSLYYAVENNSLAQGYSERPYGAKTTTAGKKEGRKDFTIFGPKSSNISALEVGASSNITKNLTGTDGNPADYAGNVVKVDSTIVTESTPYNDEYVTIDYYGNVTAKKASGVQKSYNLTTQTKYTKLKKGAETFLYETAAGGTSLTPPSELLGIQTWTVPLTVTTTEPSTSTEEPSTTEPTTAAPATYKATLSTTNVQTTIASGSQSAKGSNGSITLEAGQTVTVTPGASTYGSMVTVSDSATTVTKNSNGPYTFTMPAKAITVTVTDITLSSISATITGAGKTALSPYAFGAKTAAPTNTEIANACKQGNPSITATLSDNTTTPVTASQATYTVTTNTLGTATGTSDTITHPGTAVITVSYGGKSTTVNYYYTYTTANQKTLTGITIAAKADSTISTSKNAPTVYGAKSELPSETVIKSQLGAITASYTDSLGNKSTETISNTAAGVELKVTTTETVNLLNGVYTHAYTSQVTAAYNGKTSNAVTFYYQYQNYSVTCNTVDEKGNSITSVKATVSSTTDVTKGTAVTITTPEDNTLTYIRTQISVIGSSKKDYSNTVSNNTFAMPEEPVTVTVTYTKLSGYTVTPPTVTKLSAAPAQSALNSLLNGAYLTPEYQSTKGTKVDLTNNMVALTLGNATETSNKDGVSTYAVPVTVKFKDIEKKNAFSFTYEVKHSYTASVVQAAGPTVQVKKSGSYTSSVSGYYGDTITVKVPEETREYAFPNVTIKSETGTTIRTISQSGEETFILPAANVTITASYQKLTELIVTPPDTSKGNYSQNTTKADLPLGTITAVYGSSSQTKSIDMTRDMYTIGKGEETTTENSDGSRTITTTVPVTIYVEYGGIRKDDVTFTYSYSYTVSPDSKAIRIGNVTCGDEALDDSGLVKVNQSVADPGSEILVTVKEAPEYAFPSVVVRTASRTETLTLSGTGDEKTATFTMPNEDVEIDVDYKPLTKITLQEPDKKEYDHYTNPEDLDLTGGSLTAAYGTASTDVKSITLKTEAGVSNGCTFTCTKGTATEENGVRVIPVTVSITYGGKMVSYVYTYKELRTYSVTLNKSVLPEDFVNKEQVRLSATIGNYNDELILSLPADTDDVYAFPTVTVKCGDEVEAWEAEDGVYKTVITDDMVVSVSYCKLGKLLLTLPKGETNVGDSLVPIDALDTSDVKLELVYYNDDDEEGGRRSISASEYASFAYGKETESVTNGVCTHTVPVLVTADYNGLVETEGSYSVKYRNYVVSAQDTDGNSLSVDKNRANAGDTIAISLTPGLDVQKITADNTSVGYELSKDKTKAMIILKEDMLSAKTGYIFVVAYQTIQDIKAPTETVVVSDKIMKEEELKQALADLNSFDFGTASILVSYDELEPNTEILLNSPSVAKKLLESKTTEKESADGTYIERTYVIEATVGGKSVEVPIMVKVEKKKEAASGDASGEGTGQKNPDASGDVSGTGSGNSSGDGTGKDDEKEKPVVTSTKPGKVTGVKVTAKKRKLTVTWKAASNATAYEIWISTKKNGGYLKAATVKKSGSKKTYSYTVKKLDDSKFKKGKTYYVKVRAVNVKSKLTKKTIKQTVKSKRNRRLYVTVKSVKNAVSYTVKASTKKKSGYKTIFKFDEIGKKKYTKYIKHQKRNTKYYIKVEVKVESGKRQEGAYSSAAKVKCK